MNFYFILHFTSTFDIVLFHSLSYFVCFPHLIPWRRAQREQNIRLNNLVRSKAHLFVNIMHNKYNLLR